MAADPPVWKYINARIQNKHDTATQWGLKPNFIPEAGEIIIYDADSTHDTRFKVGDGQTKISALPFVTGVTSVNGQTGDVSLTIPTVPSNVSSFANDAGYVSDYLIPFGIVDSTSTATAFTATVPGITELKDGVCVLLKNGVITSAAGFTININSLGAKPAYSNMAAATAETTIFNINYTMMFVYDSTRNGTGGWICYRGYNSDNNTIGYQIRTNSTIRPAADKGYRYRLWFTSVDGTKWVPANTSTSTNATSSRTPNTRPIDPFGEIIYYSTNTTIEANANLSSATCWQQYTVSLGYSFNTTGAALTLTNPAPVYLKCTPQSNGGAVMEGYVQTLPSTADGKIYIYLGMAYNATNIELSINHPVYYYKDGAIRIWTNVSLTASDVNAVPTSLIADPYTMANDGILTEEGFDYATTALSEDYQVAIPTVAQVGGMIFDASNSLQDMIPTSASQVGAVPTTRTVNGKALSSNISLTASDVGALPSSTTIPSKTSDLTNDSGFLTSYTETDPTVPSWAKASSKPSYTASEVGAVPTSRTVNGKALSSNISLTASDVGALPSSTSIPSKTSDLTNDSGFLTSIPTASSSTLGGIKVGDGLSINNGILSVDQSSSGSAYVARYYTTLDYANWTLSSGKYTQTVTIQKLNYSNAIDAQCDIDMSSVNSNQQDTLDQWGKVGRIYLDSNGLHAEAYGSAPTRSLPILLRVTGGVIEGENLTWANEESF